MELPSVSKRKARHTCRWVEYRTTFACTGFDFERLPVGNTFIIVKKIEKMSSDKVYSVSFNALY